MIWLNLWFAPKLSDIWLVELDAQRFYLRRWLSCWGSEHYLDRFYWNCLENSCKGSSRSLLRLWEKVIKMSLNCFGHNQYEPWIMIWIGPTWTCKIVSRSPDNINYLVYPQVSTWSLDHFISLCIAFQAHSTQLPVRVLNVSSKP
jgi:hypothetical protein